MDRDLCYFVIYTVESDVDYGWRSMSFYDIYCEKASVAKNSITKTNIIKVNTICANLALKLYIVVHYYDILV